MFVRLEMGDESLSVDTVISAAAAAAAAAELDHCSNTL
jgi:hypothetical protein